MVWEWDSFCPQSSVLHSLGEKEKELGPGRELKGDPYQLWSQEIVQRRRRLLLGKSVWMGMFVARSHLHNVKKSYKRSHFKMESEVPFQRNCLVHLMPQTSGTLKLDKINFGNMGPKNCLQDNEKANIMKTGLKIKTSFGISLTMLCYLYQQKCL